jgi:cytochrome c oxidase cbb3-type subunit III
MDNHKIEKDAVSGVETTGHEWDGLKELNNPAPRWWLLTLVVTIVWSIGYWVVYPAWPVAGGNTQGTFGWSSQKQLVESQAEINAVRAAKMEKVAATDLSKIEKDPELSAFAKAGGAAAFKNNCAVCHGTGAQGGKGFPNLNDDDWLWGGTLEDIYTTLQYGIRSTHPDTRQSQMPAWGKDGLLTKDEINDVADFVIQLNKGNAADKTASYKKGKEIFAANCAVCHGENGEGMRAVGAPRLNDAIWLYGGDKATVVETITNSRSGVMPTWKDRLDDSTIKQLAVYVHSLGGGE